MSEKCKCVTIHSPDNDPIGYVADGKQTFAKVNVKKGLPESHIYIIRNNGFEITIHGDSPCPKDD